jgi:opacity protein-like surface antigen
MKTLILAAAACALLAPTVTPAQLVLGAQAGASLARGDLERGVPIDGDVRLAFPLELRAGWRLSPAIVVGLQGGYGLVSEGERRADFCSSTGADCGAHLWRIAARGEYGFGGTRYFPHVAATLGWQWLVERWELGADNWDQSTWGGWVLGLEAGVNLPLARKLRGGAFAGLGVSQLLTISEKGETAGYAHEDSGALASPTAQVWAGVGLRVTFEP